MSELKATHIKMVYNGEIYEDFGTVPCTQLYYRKDEADKVIAGLKDKCQMHDFFWEGCGFAKRGFKNAIAVSISFDKLEAEARYQKYRRCLAMARWCNRMFSSTFGKERYWQKWNRRWLELAEKFKQGLIVGVDKATGADKTVVINHKEAK